MSLDRVLTILGIVGGLSTVALWISKARESDVVLSLTLKSQSEEIARLRDELTEMRSHYQEGFKRVGIRLGNTRTVLYRLISHFNDPKKREGNFEYVSFKELED